MEEKEVFNKVKFALQHFLNNNRELIDINASERSLTHKMAESLQREFKNYHVDCEYNRKGVDVKKLKVSVGTIEVDDKEAKTVFPDIVIHERGVQSSNLMVIEVKKSNSTVGIDYDLKKLVAFTGEQYQYQYGLLIEIDVKNKEKPIGSVRLFQKGKEPKENYWKKLEELSYGS